MTFIWALLPVSDTQYSEFLNDPVANLGGGLLEFLVPQILCKISSHSG